MAGSKVIDFYTFSRGLLRKPASWPHSWSGMLRGGRAPAARRGQAPWVRTRVVTNSVGMQRGLRVGRLRIACHICRGGIYRAPRNEAPAYQGRGDFGRDHTS
jgi:hypothetical protein